MSAYHSVPREQQHQLPTGESEFGSSSNNISGTNSNNMRNSHRFSAPSSGEQSFRVSSLRRRSSNMSSVGSSRNNCYSNAGNNSGSISMLSYSSRDWSNRDFGLSQQQHQPGPLSPRQEQRSSGGFTTFPGSRYYHGTDGGAPIPILEMSSTSMSSSNSRGTSGSLNIQPQQPLHQSEASPSFRQQQQQQSYGSLHVPPPTGMSTRRPSDRYVNGGGPPPVSPDQRRRMTMMEPPVFQQQNSGGVSNGMMMFRGDDSVYSRRSMNSTHSAHYQLHNNHHHPQHHPYPPSPHHHHLQHHRYPEVPTSPQRSIRGVPSIPAPISNHRDPYALASKFPSSMDLPPPPPPPPPPRFRTVEPTLVETYIVSLRHRRPNNVSDDNKPFYFEVEQGTTLETTTTATESGTNSAGGGAGGASSNSGGASSSSSGPSKNGSNNSSNNDSHKHQVQCCQCQVRLLVSKEAVCVQCPSCRAVSAATNVNSFGTSSSVLTRSAAAAAAAVPAM